MTGNRRHHNFLNSSLKGRTNDGNKSQWHRRIGDNASNLITWLIALGGFAHVVAGAVEVLFLATTGAATWQQAVGGFIFPALVGNIVGGVALVAVINHAQVAS